MRLVVLTDELGRETGTAELVAAHCHGGRLHRAFSVYLFSPGRRSILMQQRSDQKMLWPGIWANTCCSHPRPGESIPDAAQRRMLEEWGFTCPLAARLSFVYRAEDPGGRGVEHEHVTIMTGVAPPQPTYAPNPAEISAWRWMPLDELRWDLRDNAAKYAPWFHLGMHRLGFEPDVPAQ
jgi:isopentenyl-diphosphate delta-isomerase